MTPYPDHMREFLTEGELLLAAPRCPKCTGQLMSIDDNITGRPGWVMVGCTNDSCNFATAAHPTLAAALLSIHMESIDMDDTEFTDVTTPLPRSRDDINRLNANWRNDPCWDIADTEGFEAHREELEAYQAEVEAEWQAKADAEAAVTPLQRAQKAVREYGHLWRTAEEDSQSHREMVAAQALAAIAQAQALTRIAECLETLVNDRAANIPRPTMTPEQIATVVKSLNGNGKRWEPTAEQWSKIPAKYVAVAKDKNGFQVAYAGIPEIAEHAPQWWIGREGKMEFLHLWDAGFIPDHVPWQKSLCIRPGYHPATPAEE